MTLLEQKLDQLSLSTMSRQLETTSAEAAAKNLSVAATLEWLADMELEARNQPRHRTPLQMLALAGAAQHRRLSLPPSQEPASRPRPRILRLLDLEFLHKGTNLVFIGNPGVGKTFLAKIIGWRACQANQRVLFTTAMDMLNHLLASQVDHSLVRKLKTYTEPTLLVCDELGYLALDQQTSNLFYQVISTRHSQKRSTIITTNTAVLRLGQHPLQYDHRHRHRRPPGGELRDLPAGRRQPAQAQESESAGRVVAAGSDASAAL